MNRNKKKKMIENLVSLFCEAKHRNPMLCESCAELLRYVTSRLNECPLDDEVSSCFMCPNYCYRPDMREKIKEVMRFSAPRILIHHPILMLNHLLHLRKLNRHF